MERDRSSSVAALRAGLDLGLSHIDTAEMYGSGQVEELVGMAVEGRRDEMFLATKVLPANASYQATVKACERSLARLRTDRIDLYLLHGPSTHPLAETFAAMEDLVTAGKILAFGVSNFDTAALEAAVRTAGPARVACNQVCYHLKARWIEHHLIAQCAALDVAVVGYSPFGQGDFPAGDPVLRSVARARGATERQVALRFLVRQGGTFTIPKSSRVGHVEEIAAASDLTLTEEDLDRLDRAFPVEPERFGLPRR